ncbi:hypothetical protein DFH28DRAFT_464390 [Melampsora americana]|nr:hypothetical protein DFH28DRAFT_464390 [Melampsora americana]
MTVSWLCLFASLCPLLYAFFTGPTAFTITEDVPENNQVLYDVLQGENLDLSHSGVLDSHIGNTFHPPLEGNPGSYQDNGINWPQGDLNWHSDMITPLQSATSQQIKPCLEDWCNVEGTGGIPIHETPQINPAFREVQTIDHQRHVGQQRYPDNQFYDNVLSESHLGRTFHLPEDSVSFFQQNGIHWPQGDIDWYKSITPSLHPATIQDSFPHPEEWCDVMDTGGVPIHDIPQTFSAVNHEDYTFSGGKAMEGHSVGSHIRTGASTSYMHTDYPLTQDTSSTQINYESGINDFQTGDYHSLLGQQKYLQPDIVIPKSKEKFHEISGDQSLMLMKDPSHKHTSNSWDQGHLYPAEYVDSLLNPSSFHWLEPTPNLMNNHPHNDLSGIAGLLHSQADEYTDHSYQNHDLTQEIWPTQQYNHPFQESLNADLTELNSKYPVLSCTSGDTTHQSQPIPFDPEVEPTSCGKRKAADMETPTSDLCCVKPAGIQHEDTITSVINHTREEPIVNETSLASKVDREIRAAKGKPGRRTKQMLWKIGSFRVNNTPILCYEIPLWFQRLGENIKKNLPPNHIAIEMVPQAIHSAELYITTTFLGILSIHYNQVETTYSQEEVLKDGWEFLKIFFSSWERLHFQDNNVQQEIVQDKGKEFLDPHSFFGYLAGSGGISVISLQVFSNLVVGWNNTKHLLNIPGKHMNDMIQRALRFYNPEFIYTQGGFYSRAGIGNPAWEALHSLRRVESTKSDSCKFACKQTCQDLSQHAQFLSPQGFAMCQEIHTFFVSLIQNLLNSYKAIHQSDIPKFEKETRSFLTSGRHLKNQSNMVKIVRAVSMAEYRVTVGFIGIVKVLYKDDVTEDELKIITSSAWEFLKVEFNRWTELDFREYKFKVLSSCPSETPGAVVSWVDYQTCFSVLWSWSMTNNFIIPIQYVRYLIKSWSKSLPDLFIKSPGGSGFTVKKLPLKNLSSLLQEPS